MLEVTAVILLTSDFASHCLIMQATPPHCGSSKWWKTCHAVAGAISQASVVIEHWQGKAPLHEAAGFVLVSLKVMPW